MAKKLPLDNDMSIDDLVINWEDDIYMDFPFLKLKENGLSMEPFSDLTVIQDNMVRGLSVNNKTRHYLDGLEKSKLEGLRGSLQYGWDRTSWPFPFIFVNGEKQIFDRRHTFYVLKELSKQCGNISVVPTAEYVRVKSDLGGIINRFSDSSIQMMASMWGNVYGPTSDDAKDHQFVGAITKICRQEKEFLNISKKTFTREVIAEIFKYMGGEDRYSNPKKTTHTKIVNAVFNNINSSDSNRSVAIGCINNNIDAFEAFINDSSNEWLANNKENALSNTIYRNYVVSSNTYHITDAVRRLMKSLCAEEQNKDPRTTKVLLYNEKESNQSGKIYKSRDNFEDALAEIYYPIRDAALLPIKEHFGEEYFTKIPKKSLNDFDLEVYAMHQIDGEEEPVRLTFPDEIVKKKKG
tara:strand:- start:1491 stop:2714 length:1224 start_codon:yes stop_codon:yes gene_type:complete